MCETERERDMDSLVIQRAPATIRIHRAQTLRAGREAAAVLDLHLDNLGGGKQKRWRAMVRGGQKQVFLVFIYKIHCKYGPFSDLET